MVTIVPGTTVKSLIRRMAIARLSLVHTVPVYAPVRPGSLQPADWGKPGGIVKEFECVHTLSVELRTRPGLGQKLITVCPGYVIIFDGAFPV